MKKLTTFASALALAACGKPAPPSADDYSTWADPSTGCVYLVYENGWGQSRVGSLSIRFREDGTPDCPGSTMIPVLVNPMEDPE